MLENPQIPIFVLQELSSNPDRMPQIIREMGLEPELAIEKMGGENWKEMGAQMEPKQLILNLMSLCIFPFVARPVATEILYNGDDEAFIEAMKHRKELLPLLLKNIMIQNNRL